MATEFDPTVAARAYSIARKQFGSEGMDREIEIAWLMGFAKACEVIKAALPKVEGKK